MLSFDEHPGIVSFLVGIIVLVMGAVGLSLVIDKRLKASSGIVRIEREIGQGSIELEVLLALHAERSRFLANSTPTEQAGSMASEAIFGELEKLRQQHASMEMTGKQLRGELIRLEGDFSEYRKAYRRKVWAEALGESLGDLKLRDGREYRQAKISRVTDVGLEIRHADGIARIQAPDLDQKTKDRFQWNDEMRRQIMESELENLKDEVIEKNPESPGRNVSSSSHNTALADREELKRLRRLVSGWQLKVDQLSRDRADAESHAAYGNSASVPGSLETWGGKATRLENELTKARKELAAAKARALAVSPNP